MKHILLVGEGAREHCLAVKLSESSLVGRISVYPGNGGTVQQQKCTNLTICKVDSADLADLELEWLRNFCLTQKVDLVVVGSEVWLERGLVNTLQARDIRCFGPTREGAQIETSKLWSKKLMTKYGIPTAEWDSFTDEQEALKFVEEHPTFTIVKASGLAGGKGVTVCNNKIQVSKAIHECLVGKFGNSGKVVILEERLIGDEISLLCLTDGKTVQLFPSARDYKRAKGICPLELTHLTDHDRGSNTGGMGAYTLHNTIDLEKVKETIILPTLSAILTETGHPFVGILYAGLILTDSGIQVIEFNARFGDPETQVILPLLKTDLFQLLDECARGKLETKAEWSKEFAVGIVATTSGYPEYRSPSERHKIKDSCTDKTDVYYSRTIIDEWGQMFARDGRVLTVVGRGNFLEQARKQAYNRMAKIYFEGITYRSDIGTNKVRLAILTSGKATSAWPMIEELDKGHIQVKKSFFFFIYRQGLHVCYQTILHLLEYKQQDRGVSTHAQLKRRVCFFSSDIFRSTNSRTVFHLLD